MTSMTRVLHCEQSGANMNDSRKGGFMVLALFCFIGCLFFVCLSVDVGYLTSQKTKMQNAVDAAALAAAQEITAAVQNAPIGTTDITGYALGQARLVAANVAQMNGVYVNSAQDVRFGKRLWNAATQKFETTWNTSTANVVEVTARRTGSNPAAQDGKLKLFFAGVTGDRYAQVTAKAIAYVEARDMVVVHDFSRSMNFDSFFNTDSVANLTNAQIASNLGLVWTDLALTAGTLSASPQYLTISNTANSVTTTGKFKYKTAEVTSTGTITNIQLRYTDNTTYNITSGLSANPVTYTATKDINRITVTTNYTTPMNPETITNSGATIVFSGDRKTATITTPGYLQEMQVQFTNGTSYNRDWSSSGTYSYTYTSTKAIDYIELDWYGTSWKTFNASAAGGVTSSQSQQFDDTDSNVKTFLGISSLAYPYPSGSWDSYINYVRTSSDLNTANYREVWSGLTFAAYVLENEASHSRTPKLAYTRHYPFHAIKRGHEVLCTFLGNLGFDDHIGMVSYDDSHRQETTLSETGLPSVNIASKPITNNYTAVNNLMKYKQAGHYTYSTNMGGGLKEGVAMLDSFKREGARPTIILMTDGNANNWDSGESGTLPTGWSWDALFDYDGNGVSDFSTSDNYKRNVLVWAQTAHSKGYTVHCIGVGSSADNALLGAVAHIGEGHHIAVSGAATPEQLEAQMLAAFHKIASFVPPAKLMPQE